MSNKSKNFYMVMDGRARFDIDSASILEVFEASNHKNAKQYAKDSWNGTDYVVVTWEQEILN